jgi:hypothetical protein
MRTRFRLDDDSRETERSTNSEGKWSRPAMLVGSALLAMGLGLASDAEAQTAGNTTGYGYERSATVQSEYHEVDEGDTLYDLSGQYFGNPRQWPKLWSYNSHITNPHWIYPGDIIYLQSSGAREQQDKDKEKKAAGETDDQGKSKKGMNEEGLRVSTAAFITSDEPQFVGRIVDSPKASTLLGEFDSCWVGFGEDGYIKRERNSMRDKNIQDLKDPGEVSRKDRFAIVEPSGDVTDDDGNVVGQKYLVLGSLVVTETSEDKLETAYIDQSWREIERGAYLVPYDRQLKLVDHVPAQKDLVARIVDSLSGRFDFGESHYVFLDKGASDGVRVGNRLYIYQQHSGLSKNWGGETPEEIPWERVGRVRVVDVTENFATAIVTSSQREVTLGDRLEMYKGN